MLTLTKPAWPQTPNPKPQTPNPSLMRGVPPLPKQKVQRNRTSTGGLLQGATPPTPITINDRVMAGAEDFRCVLPFTTTASGEPIARRAP